MMTIKELIQCLWADIKAYLGSNYQPKGSYASSNHNHNSAYLGIKAKAESAKSADSVAWNNVSGKPTIPSNTNQLTNGAGFITSSGSCNYANSSGNADTVDGSHAWQMQTLNAGGVAHGSGVWLMQCQHNVDGDNYFKLYCGDKSIGIKVDRASSAGYSDSAGSATNATYTNWLRTSSHSDHIFHTDWDGTYFWTYVTASDGGYRAVRVARSDSSGYADNCGYSRLLTTYADDGHYLCPDRYDGWNTRLYMTYGDKGVKADRVHVHHADYSSRSAGDGAFYISGYQIYVG